jgi:hypothetical protein
MAGAKLKYFEVKKTKALKKPYRLFDGGGMFLYVTSRGNRVWRW